MISIATAPALRKVTDSFKDTQVFGYGVLAALFLLHLLGLASLSELVRSCGWCPSVSTVDRAVQKFQANRFMRRLQGSLLRRFRGKLNSDDFCFVIDDVPVEKYGEKIPGIGSWGRHGGGLFRGQRIMVLALVDRQRGVAFPLAYAVCLKKDDPSFKKGTDLALELIDEILRVGFPHLPVVVDSWFDSLDFMAALTKHDLSFVLEAKSNRKVRRTPAPQAKWKSWVELFTNTIRYAVKLPPTRNTKEPRGTKYIAERRVFLRGCARALKAAAVYNKPHWGTSFAVYVTNDLMMSGAEIWALSRSRWHIEEMFRILKQDLSFCALPVSGATAGAVSICLPFALLQTLHLDEERWSDRRSATIGSLVKEFRERELERTLADVAANSRRRSVLYLRARRAVERNSKKPVDPTADELSTWKTYVA